MRYCMTPEQEDAEVRRILKDVSDRNTFEAKFIRFVRKHSLDTIVVVLVYSVLVYLIAWLIFGTDIPLWGKSCWHK